MRKHLLCGLLTALLAILASTTDAQAQAFTTFTLSGQASPMSMGDVAFLTPELAACSVSMGASYAKWLPKTMNYSSLQAGGFISFGSKAGIRFDYRNNLFSEFPILDNHGNPKGSCKPFEQRILIGTQFRLADKLFIDVNAKYLNARLGDPKASCFAGDVGAAYCDGGLTVGIKVSDAGSKYNFGTTAYSLPTRVQVGGSYNLTFAGKHGMLLAADLGYIMPKEYNTLVAAVGAEYNYHKIIYFRAGYHFSKQVAPKFASFGLGAIFKGIRLDAAYLLTGSGGNAWAVTLRYTM